MGIKERKERERQQRHSEILEAAREVFENKGFLNTTLQDVADAAEISVGLIYRYFQSKEDMFAALALKGAEEVDREISEVLAGLDQQTHPPPVKETLFEIGKKFYDFYGPYGEYFDMMLYSYKGLKKVQIHATTLTRLMSVTLSSIDKLKNFILECPQLRAKDEDEALMVVFLLWGILLGCHKLFDSSGRGHIIAFSQDEFLRQTIDQMLVGIAENPAACLGDKSRDSEHTETELHV